MGFLYRAVRPLLFRLPPETAHHLGIAVLKACSGAARWIGPGRTDPSLRVTLGRGEDALEFPGPVGLAAGFDKDGEALPALAALGFGFIEAGTLTPRPQPGNPGPRLFRFPAQRALVNRLGFNNAGVEAAAARFARWPALGVPRGVNLGKNKDTPNDRAADDYLTGLTRLYGAADFFVVNVSSPNTPGLRGLQEPERLGPLLAGLRARADALKRERGKPKRPLLFVKVSPDDGADAAWVETVVGAGFDGIVATNTTKDRAGLPPDAPAEGGLSGAPLRERSTEMVRRLYRAARGRLAIIGVGGVFDARDAWEKIEAGASLVELYTGFVYGGPSVARDIHRGLSAMLKHENIRLADIVGRRA